MFGRYDIYHEIQSLDPIKDHQKIVYLVGTMEYPWLIKKSLEFALFRTYAVPHTSRILKATGQFGSHGQKRYDDTSLMMSGIAEHGYDSDFAKIVIGQMNKLHGRYSLRNEDMLYVLSTFVFEPTRWHQKYGWRTPTQTEKLANFYFWREVGIRMGIKDIPESYEEYERFNIEHEQKYFDYDDANHYIGEKTFEVFLSWYPAPIRFLVRQAALSLMDDDLLYAMGFEKPHAAIRYGVHYALKIKGFLMRFLPPRREPFIYTEIPSRTYPHGFDAHELGAKPEHGDLEAVEDARTPAKAIGD